MSSLRVRGAFGTLDLDLPLEAFVVVSGAENDAAERLAFGIIAAEGQRCMAPLLAPAWLPARSRVQVADAGRVHGLRPLFEFRHEDAHWPDATRLGQILGILPAFQRALGCSKPGLCIVCSGAGRRAQVDVAALVPDPMLSIAAGAIAPWSGRTTAKKNPGFFLGVLQSLAVDVGFDIDAPWASLDAKAQAAVLHGVSESNYNGVVHDVERRLARSGAGRGAESMADLERFVSWSVCMLCEGTGLDAEACRLERAGIRLPALQQTSVADVETVALALGEEFLESEFVLGQAQAAISLGLGDCKLGQIAGELSVVLASQLRMAEVLGSGLQRALYVLQSPTLDLSSTVRASTIAHLQRRVALGDSILMVAGHPDFADGAGCLVALRRGSSGAIELTPP